MLKVLTWTAAYADCYLRVGSFNIANFGSSDKGEYERQLVSLVNIILEMDANVIALQEIEPTELGTQQVERLTKLINKVAKYYKKPFSACLVRTQRAQDLWLTRQPGKRTEILI